MGAAKGKSAVTDSGLVVRLADDEACQIRVPTPEAVIRSLPESQALDILRILRSHDELETIRSIVQANRSAERHALAQEWLSTSTRQLGLEYELMTRYPVSFPPLQPVESNTLKTVLSTIYLAIADSEASQSPPVAGASSSSDPSSNPFCARSPTKSPVAMLHRCDERLEEINMCFWTSVSIPNDLAASIISLYLEIDHPLLGTFDPNLFIDDLVNCRLRRCSGLLISALMYLGCQMYSTSVPEVRKYLPQFSEEAEKRWSEEKAIDSLLNLAGTQLLGLAYLGEGKDHYFLTYVSEANAMGTRRGLFGVNPEVVASKVREITPELQNATSYAAWGTFNWIILMALFYQHPASHTRNILLHFQYPGVDGTAAPSIAPSLFRSHCNQHIWAIPFQSYAGSGAVFTK
ncbi:hypothetical protein FOMG_17724 [Fusarium oxysporum f. sp. melonis 26406]|uniref:Uncharacterized protein n=1 Tax=Fusarium oxysporum f. sp. melonis 26406 TaxID=1089452 RepID=W9ZBI9_FUSOX|nr:hypothetical protein FOMG_17724 [Fusarium oxysporum f. sp. melonis 26406]